MDYVTKLYRLLRDLEKAEQEVVRLRGLVEQFRPLAEEQGRRRPGRPSGKNAGPKVIGPSILLIVSPQK
jgi:hypothetical protein